MTTWTCPVHTGQVKFVPPGVSGPNSKKPGTPYAGFFKCPVNGCEQRPPKDGAQQAPPARQAVQGPGAPARTPAAPKPPDWDAIGDIKMRCAMWCAWASGNRPWGEFWGIVNDGATFIKHNALPDFEDALEERWEHVPLDEQ